MHGDDLAIFLFLLTLGAAFVVETVKAETLSRRVAFGSLAAFFLLVGLSWLQLKKVWPPLTEWAGSIATNPMSWFIVFMFIVAIFAFHRPKNTNPLTSNPDRLEKTIWDLAAKIAGLEKTVSRDQEPKLKGLPLSQRLDNIDSTLFYLVTRDIDVLHMEMLEAALALEPIQYERAVVSPPTETMVQETESLLTYMKSVLEGLGNTKWRYELGTELDTIERTADYTLQNMTLPDGVHHVVFRRNHIAKLQRDRCRVFLQGTLNTTREQQGQLLQRFYERKKLHKLP